LPATTITTTTYYNSGGLKEDGSKKDLSNGFRLWIDMVEPTTNELINLQNEYNVVSHAMDLIKQKTKRPQT
jgi:Mg2+ and Co2+ transporter CorA